MNLAEQAKEETKQLIADVEALLEQARQTSVEIRGAPHLTGPERLQELLNTHRVTLCGVMSQARRVQATLGAACICRQMEGEAIALPDRQIHASNDKTFEEELFE